MKLLEQPTGLRLGDWLNKNLDCDWSEFRAAIAFVKLSGVKHIAEKLTAYAKLGRVEIIVGIDHQGTSYEGLKGLMKAVSSSGRVAVFHNTLLHTFHPKIYLFKSINRAEVVIGSGNLTQGGLFTNYEAGLQVELDLNSVADRELLKDIERALDAWSDSKSGTLMDLNDENLDSLIRADLVLKEIEMPRASIGENSPDSEAISGDGKVITSFQARTVPAAPPIILSATGTDSILVSLHRYAMTLQKTDVGVGQITVGTSRRSPEIFIPLKARDANPRFWGWKEKFKEDPDRSGKFDRKSVRMRVGNDVVEVNMMTWPDRRDFRLRNEALRSLGEVGDILVIEKVKGANFEYDVKVISVGSKKFEIILAKCDQTVQNSEKRFGYF